jgi:NAD(P)-dependent dehydrogenase (short-subunit alcohol dehydrogenase family)
MQAVPSPGAGLIGKEPPGASGIAFEAMDVTDASSIDRVVAKCPTLDIVVNAAGVIRRGEEHDPEVFRQVIDINLNGAMRVAAATRQRLAASGGSLVNIASMLSFFGGGLVPAYSASKGGIAQLTKSLAIAWAADGVRVNAVAPGWIATPLTQGLQDDAARSAAVISRTPIGRWGPARGHCGPGDVPLLELCRLRHRHRAARRRRLSRRLISNNENLNDEHFDPSCGTDSG